MQLVAVLGVLLGVCTFGYLNGVIIPSLKPNQTEPFPPCEPDQWYTTRGASEPADRFLCMIVPFFIRATESPMAAYNWAQLILIFSPVGVRLMEFALASTEDVRRPWWVGVWVAFVTVLLGQLLGISVTFPAIALPIYSAWRARIPESAGAVPSVHAAGMLVPWTFAATLPILGFFAFPHASTLWIVTAVVFQPLPPLMQLLMLPATLCGAPSGASKSHAHVIMAGLYLLIAGGCALAHALTTLTLLYAAEFSAPNLLMMAQGAWTDYYVRFLVVDHAVLALAVLLMLVVDGGVLAVSRVLFLTPFLSLGGSVAFYFGYLHLGHLFNAGRERVQERVTKQKSH